MSTERIAIVGIGLRYPDAGSPDELWENVLAGRQAFRRLPDERMNHADYFSPDPDTPDRFYSSMAAVLRDFEFDRTRYKVAGSTYRSTDLTHWLAMDVAAAALADAGFPEGKGLPRQTTGVVIGNSLIGEFARANMMRVRWPYVRRTVAATLTAKGWADDEAAEFLRTLEAQYKAPFPAVDEDSLAGGLSNTIAGRICNYFDLHGGGYTVDGACSSSLLSIATAAKAVSDRDLDVAIAGGVDLSIDPFEVIGFAKTGALATREMKVYDRDSNGFWPGEGCGLLVLVRESEALRRGSRIYATIPGWGISPDGKGGITRPEAGGHRLALARAYERAGYGVETVGYFEGHGTGTALGDATEIGALSAARRDADPGARPAALSTVKGNFGHTKAAAGVAGLIKAALAVYHQVIPPGTGQDNPHPQLLDGEPTMYVPREAELWPQDNHIRAGVSALGFGGINTHITVDQPPGVARRTVVDDRTRGMVAGRQDAERKLRRLLALLDDGATSTALAEDGIFLGQNTAAPRIALLFPGQGSGRGATGSIRRRFAAAETVLRAGGAQAGADQVATEVAQPRIVAGSIAALRVLQDIGIDGDVAVGHSLGELTALHWGGALTAGEVLELARVRGRVMADASRGGGAMAGLSVEPEQAERLLPWVRAYRLEHVVQDAPAVQPVLGSAQSTWAVHATPGHPLAGPLHAALATAGIGNGILLCLPSEGTDHVNLMLEAGRSAVTAQPGTRFVVVQQGFGASGLARTLHLENSSVPTTVVDLADVLPTDPAGIRQAVTWVVREAAATTGFAAVAYAADGTRTVPSLRLVHAEANGPAPLGPDDVLLVTGGGKGITAECALMLAAESGARLALVGRADPAEDAELSANLSRIGKAGVQHRYLRADVADAEQVAAVVATAEKELGPVTAVLHGAGRNHPTSLATLTREEFRRTLAPKVAGLRTVLDAVDPDRLRLLITFGSIIGRAGLHGEAHYSTADWLTELAVRHGQAYPRTRVLALEWSVWAGVGMGERLGAVEALIRDGIMPISVEDGLSVLRQVLRDPSAGTVLVIHGRSGGLPTLPSPRRELPLARFLDRILVHYPDVELVTEAELSDGSDPYLGDHLLSGDLLFPAALGMEAMTQVAAAVSGGQGPPLLEDVEFLRPVVVRPGESTTIRLAALVRDPGTVDVVLRSAETGFGADHFRARLRFPRPGLPGGTGSGDPGLPVVPVDPVAEMYGGLLFQGKRFQRVLAYRRASARHAVAELSTSAPAPWFAAFLSQELLLADPGTRDAVMHAIQCCIPDATLLPQRLERLYLSDRMGQDMEYVIADARERSQDGDSYTYDVDVRTPAGTVVERWEGLTLRAVRRGDGSGPWVPSLLGSHLERGLEQVLGGRRAVVVEPGPVTGDAGAKTDRRAQTELALARALNRPVTVDYRPDGKPEVEGAAVSAAHAAGLTLAVAGTGRIGCDIEVVTERGAEDWADLLGNDHLGVRDLLMTEAGESAAAAGTRVWCALECLRKAGSTSQALTVEQVHPHGWVVLSAGDARIATWVTTVGGRPGPLVFAVLAGRHE